MKDKPLISVIVPTKNSEATIEKCLHSIRNQTYSNIEIILVDNQSNDKTKEIAQTYNVKVIECKAEMSLARNIGIGKAIGDYILSLDSDMELTQRVIEECVNKVNEGYEAVIIPEASVGIGFWAKCKALEKSCYIADDAMEAARFVERSAFNAVNGYNPKLLFGEDKDLDIRIRDAGFKIGRINVLIQHNEGKLSLRETLLKKHCYGKTLDHYRRINPKEAKRQLILIRPAFVRNWRTLKKDPVHAFGMLFMKNCELLATLLGVIGK